MTRVLLHTLPTCVAEARKLALRLNVPIHEISSHPFPDGELRVVAWPASPTAIVYASLDHPNEKLIALMFAADSLRRHGCTRLVLVAPYLCYMRQDTEFHPGESISQTVIGQLLAQHFNRVITVDAHLHRTPSLGDVCPWIEADNLSVMPAIANHMAAGRLDPRTVIVGPDQESRNWVGQLCSLLHMNGMVATKTRLGDHVRIDLEHPEMLAGHPVLLIDDIVSSGGTIEACARAVIAAGASSVDAIVTHALFPAEMMPDLLRSGIRSVRSTDSVPHFTNAIALDRILADALRPELASIRAREERS